MSYDYPMFKALWGIGKEEGAGAMAVRRAVFVEERGMDCEREFDLMDEFAAHLFVSDEAGVPIAAGRMYPEAGRVMLDRIAVMPDFRSLPYDDLVLRVMLYKAQQTELIDIAAAVEPGAEKLYIPFGFRIAGETLLRGEKTALYTVPRQNVIWDSACKHEKQ